MDTKVTKNIMWGVIAVIVIVLGAYGISSNSKEKAMMEQKAGEEKIMMEKKAMEEKTMTEQKQMEADKMMENKDEVMMKQDGAMMSKGSYEVYDPSKLAMAEKGKVVLFFRASWCPSCRTLDADIKANLGEIPAGVTILDVDYDKYGELKQKYAVTMQHNLVQVDAQGNQIVKWSGGATLTSIVEKIK